MAFKMGGLGLSTFAGENNLGSLLLDGKRPPNGHDKFSVPAKISVQTSAGEDPMKVHERMLRQAASRAGLDGTEAQETFVKKYAQFGIDFANSKNDPSPADGLAVKTGDVKTENVSYTLGQDEIETLKSLQKEYLTAGGKLHPGKSYQSAPGATESNGSAAAKQAKNNEAYERDKLNRLFRDAQIPDRFGTPSKLRDLKHISVTLPEKLEAGLSNEDHALLALIQKTYGGGNLQGDNIKEILDLAKQSGVRAENLAVETPKAEFDLSVESLLKLHTAYIGVQGKTNALVDLYQQTADDSVASRFLKGVFEGAWENVKEKGLAIADPVGTLTKMAEVVRQIASIDPAVVGAAMMEAAGNAPELIKQGATAIGNTKVADAAEAIGALEVPVGAKVVEIGLAGNGSIKLPMLEVKRLDEVVRVITQITYFNNI